MANVYTREYTESLLTIITQLQNELATLRAQAATPTDNNAPAQPDTLKLAFCDWLYTHERVVTQRWSELTIEETNVLAQYYWREFEDNLQCYQKLRPADAQRPAIIGKEC
jgi:hypothetical protein